MQNVSRFVTILLFATTQAVAQDPPAAAPAEAAPAEAAPAAEPALANEPAPEAAAAPAAEAPATTPAVTNAGGYGSAGCGLGTLLFDPSNSITQIFAATTNGTSGSQTFGISSGTSNCDGAGYQPGSTSAYIQTNRAALAKDISRGKGATIAGLSNLAGCGDSRAVARTLKRNFKAIFPSAAAGDQTVTESMLRVLKSDQKLVCTNLA